MKKKEVRTGFGRMERERLQRMNNKYCKWKCSLPTFFLTARAAPAEHARVHTPRARMYARGHAISSLARAFAPLLRRPIVPPLSVRRCYVTRDRESTRRVLIASRFDCFFSYTCAHIVCQSASRSLFRSRTKMSAVGEKERQRGRESTHATHARNR